MQIFLSVLQAVASQAITNPDKIAIIEAETDRKCTYGELWAYVKAFSKRLISEGVKRDFGDGYGTRVVVRCAQTIDYVVTELSVQLAGGVMVPVEKNIAEIRIIEIMQETDSTILIATKPLTEYGCTYIPLDEATIEKDMMDDKNVIFPYTDALALILFTTGTTGNSKGIMLSHGAVTARVLSSYSACSHDNEQISLIPSPLSHVTGLIKIYVSLFYQCTAVLMDGFVFAKLFFTTIKKHNVTILNLLPAVIEMYLKAYRDKLEEISNQINFITFGGSSSSETQIELLRKIFTRSKIIQFYGSTEIPACFMDYTQKSCSGVSVGRPRLGTKVVFFEEKKEKIIETSKSNPGLFAISSDSKMYGYWKNPELTASVSRGEYIILSDLGYKGDDGLFYFVSRADDVIISGGYKIAPIEIEEAANSFEGIRESACVPVADTIMGQVPKLFVVMEENHVFNLKNIYSFLKSKLEISRLPRYIEEIDCIPKINNKINRRELKKL
jgi:long-chain acyl-CoA synthetase